MEKISDLKQFGKVTAEATEDLERSCAQGSSLLQYVLPMMSNPALL